MIEIPDREYRKLLAAAELYRSLIKTAPDAITVTDLDGCITEVSQQTLELHGYTSEKELLGKSAFDLIAPEDRPRALQNLQKILSSGAMKNIEYILIKKGGTRFIGELSASLVKDELGKPRAFIAITRDISDRKTAEESLRESEQLYRNLVESLEDSVFIFGRDLCIHYANNFAAATMGFRPSDIIGKTLHEIALPHTYEREKWNIQQAFEIGKAFNYQRRIRLDNHAHWFDTQLIPVAGQDNQVKFVLTVSRDMTKYKKVEDDLLRRMGELKEFNDQAVKKQLRLTELEREVEKLKLLLMRQTAKL